MVRSVVQLAHQDDDPPPTLFLHCVHAYAKMFEQAKGVAVDAIDSGGFENGQEQLVDYILVWEGMLTRLITNELNLSVPYYSSVTKALKRMGCITQLRRGGGSAPSQWQIHHEPVLDTFMSGVPKKDHKPVDKYSMVLAQIMELNNRVLKLEGILEQVLKEAS